MDTIIFSIASATISSILIYAYTKSKSKNEINQINLKHLTEINSQSQLILNKEQEIILLNEKHHSELNANIAKYQNDIDKLIMEKDNAREDLLVQKNNEIELIIQKQKEENRSFGEKLLFIEESKNDMILQFKNLSQNVLKEQTASNNEKIENIVNPFKEQLKEFKEQVSTVYTNDTKDRAILKEELRFLKDMNGKMTEETSKLSRALKGDNKALGNWGEMILESVLENSGLRKDKEYSREVTLKHNDGTIFRPDVIIHLPDKRDVIIDSKSSLVSYEAYIRTGDKNELKSHIGSIKKHIKDLSEKKYDKLDGVNSLSFVFMFIPIESALSSALSEDKELFDKAYKSNIFLVSPSTLIMALKTVENTWKHKRQQENVVKIVNKAGSLYDKFAGFISDIEKIGEQLKTVTKTYDNATNKLYIGNANIVKQVTELKDMGANTSKDINIKKDI